MIEAASHLLVHKLNLLTTPHPKPYSLYWFNDDGEVKVKEQVLITFKVGGYEDERLFDVVPMDVSYILLGRPWQYDRHVMHDGRTNKVHLTHRGKKFIIPPLSPSQVREDQRHMEKVSAEFYLMK